MVAATDTLPLEPTPHAVEAAPAAVGPDPVAPKARSARRRIAELQPVQLQAAEPAAAGPNVAAVDIPEKATRARRPKTDANGESAVGLELTVPVAVKKPARADHLIPSAAREKARESPRPVLRQAQSTTTVTREAGAEVSG